VIALLEGRERELMEQVALAYQSHAGGDSSLPHSTFLRFPDEPRNRIIALPAYLGAEFDIAGIKWVSSFPGNLQKGLDRASAAIILNSAQTGRPRAIIEGSIISAKRTAASAALAAVTLSECRSLHTVGLIGCGLINFEIARFLCAASDEIGRLVIFDKREARAEHFRDKCGQLRAGIEVEIANDIESVLEGASLISLATTAATPHISDLSRCHKGSVLLHISLRDLSPEAILNCDNVVDDIDHVSRAQTSIHLAEQLAGNRDFIRCTLADILNRTSPARINDTAITVFSPFGLGVLDLAVGKHVYDLACESGVGTVMESFLPDSWTENDSSDSQKRT
jgi:ornithine cyclodeaminase